MTHGAIRWGLRLVGAGGRRAVRDQHVARMVAKGVPIQLADRRVTVAMEQWGYQWNGQPLLRRPS